MKEYETEEVKISKINSAGLINLTLKSLWDDFYNHLRGGRFSKANSDLDCLWIEFSGELKEKDTEFTTYHASEKKIIHAFSLIPPQIKGFSTLTKPQLLARSRLYRHLIKKAVFLRKLQNTQGKGTAYLDDDQDGFD